MLAFFFWKKAGFFGKNVAFIQCNSVGAVLGIFSSGFSCSNWKGYFQWKCKFYRLPVHCFKLVINQKMAMMSKFAGNIGIFKYFWRCFVSVVKFSYWFKFHVSIITGSAVMTIFFYKGLARILEIESTPTWVLPIIWRPEWVMDTKFDIDVSKEMWLSDSKWQWYSFYRFLIIKGKATGE